MRCMLLVIPKGYENAPPDAMPDPRAVAAMMQYNKALVQAGVLRAIEGLAPPATGVRVSFACGQPVVARGPFPGSGDAVGGYWILEVASQEEAVEWAKRCPMMNGETIEVRQIHELSDYPPDVQHAARGIGELRAALDRPRPGAGLR